MSDTDYDYWIDQGQQYCYVPDQLTYAEDIHGGLTLQTIMAIIGGLLALITLLLGLFNAYRHLRTYTCPVEQRQIVRIIFTPFFFSLFYWLSICWYDASFFLEPIANLYEMICMVAVFLMFVAFIVPGAEDRSNVDRYFVELPRLTRFRKKPKHNRGSLRWFYVIWILIFQILICRVGYNIGEWAFWANACPLDTEPTPLQVIEPIFMVAWVLGLLSFYARMKPELKERNAFFKAFCFKTIVLLQVIQTPIFDNLLSGGSVSPTSTVSYADLDVGIPAFVVCCEMLIFGILFFVAYPTKDYKQSNGALESRGLKQPLPVGAAIIDVINLKDIFSGLDFWTKFPVIFGKKPKVQATLQPQMSQDQQHLWQQGNQQANSLAADHSPGPRFSEGGHSQGAYSQQSADYNTPPQGFAPQGYDGRRY